MILFSGGRGIDVEVVKETAKTRTLKFRPFSPLSDEIKMMRGSQFSWDDKTWRISKCPRNEFQLSLLRGEVPAALVRYDTPIVPEKLCPSERSLLPHQPAMISHLLLRQQCILAAEPGTGKTLAVIEGMERVCGNWLYVAPAKVLLAVQLEFKKWNAQVIPQWCSYSSLPKLLENWEGPAPIGVVYDESSRIKTPPASCAATRAAQHLADSIREESDGFVWLLTGTPAPLAPTDWWSQAEVAFPGFLRESSKAHLERRCAILEPMEVDGQRFSVVVGWKEDEVKLLAKRLEGLVYVVLSADVQNLPEICYHRVVLPPSETCLRNARFLADSQETALGALNVTRQLSDGFVYTEDKSVVRGESPKDGALANILAGSNGRAIVYAAYRASIERCVEICLEEGWEVIRCDGRGWRYYGNAYENVNHALLAMDRGSGWTEGRLAFVAHPQSGGMGLTLHASKSIAFFSNTFTFEHRAQGIKRGHREGMGDSFDVYDLIHLPTDRLVLDNNTRKGQLQKLTMEEIRSCLTQDSNPKTTKSCPSKKP